MLERYNRQMLLPEIGQEGQKALAKASVTVVGCGALGTVAAEILARAGVGHLTLIDRDIVELTNLQRQFLFTEQDVAASLPKAEAVKRHLMQINSSISVKAHVADLSYRNVRNLLSGSQVVVDATDNFLVRLLINDACLQGNTPWVYGGAIGTSGMVMPVIPGETSCFRCLVPELPPAGSMDTCDLVGVLGSVTAVVASLQAAETIKLLVNPQAASRELLELNVWKGQFRYLAIPRDDACPACQQGHYQFLEGHGNREAVALCGRNSVQVWPGEGQPAPDFAKLAERLSPLGEITFNRFTLRFKPTGEQLELTLFRDGRAMISGLEDANQALSCYTRYLG